MAASLPNEPDDLLITDELPHRIAQLRHRLMGSWRSELARKRMEVFKEAVVGIQRIAVLGNAENPLHRFLWDDLQPLGPALGLQCRLLVVSGLENLPAVFSTMKHDGFDAMTLLSDAQFFFGSAADKQPRCDASTSSNV